MFAVIFEVQRDPTRLNAYLDIAKSLRPQLESIPGFIENVRYSSLTREGWVLSLSTWADEKALIRWRTKESHHNAQQKGRDGVFLDYHLRVGQIVSETGGNFDTSDNMLGEKERFDATEIGEAKFLVLVDGLNTATIEKEQKTLPQLASYMGLDPEGAITGLLDWDVMEAVLDAGDLILLSSWTDESAAREFCASIKDKSNLRQRQIRVIRDYGKYDRREAPQYYSDADGRETIH